MGRAADAWDRCGRILEAHGTYGQPTYLVAFDEEHEGLVFSGPDAVVEHAERDKLARG